MTAYDEQNLKVNGTREIDNLILENVCTSFKTKFKCSFNARNCFITFELKQPCLVRGYAIRTADDEQDQDPKSWSLIVDEINIHTGEILNQEKEVSHITLKPEERVTQRYFATRY